MPVSPVPPWTDEFIDSGGVRLAVRDYGVTRLPSSSSMVISGISRAERTRCSSCGGVACRRFRPARPRLVGGWHRVGTNYVDDLERSFNGSGSRYP